MGNLAFRDCVLIEFSHLLRTHNFECVRANECYLRFESKNVFAEVLFDCHRTLELDFTVGLLDDLYDGEERPFHLGEMIRYSDPIAGKDYRLLEAS